MAFFGVNWGANENDSVKTTYPEFLPVELQDATAEAFFTSLGNAYADKVISLDGRKTILAGVRDNLREYIQSKSRTTLSMQSFPTLNELHEALRTPITIKFVDTYLSLVKNVKLNNGTLSTSHLQTMMDLMAAEKFVHDLTVKYATNIRTTTTTAVATSQRDEYARLELEKKQSEVTERNLNQLENDSEHFCASYDIDTTSFGSFIAGLESTRTLVLDGVGIWDEKTLNTLINVSNLLANHIITVEFADEDNVAIDEVEINTAEIIGIIDVTRRSIKANSSLTTIKSLIINKYKEIKKNELLQEHEIPVLITDSTSDIVEVVAQEKTIGNDLAMPIQKEIETISLFTNMAGMVFNGKVDARVISVMTNLKTFVGGMNAVISDEIYQVIQNDLINNNELGTEYRVSRDDFKRAIASAVNNLNLKLQNLSSDEA